MSVQTQTIISGELYRLPSRPNDPENRVDHDVVLADDSMVGRAIEALNDAEVRTRQRESLLGHFTITTMSPDGLSVLATIPMLHLRVPGD